jgi:hypothetical protein
MSQASPYNVDMDSKVRGSDGLWDRGAYEYGGTATATPAPTPTPTPIAGTNPTPTPTPIAGTNPTPTPTPVPTTAGGLVAAYSFNEGTGTTSRDLSGNNNTATLSGATWTTTAKGGRALSFNGTGSRVVVNDALNLHLTYGMTLEAWVYPTNTGATWRCVIMKEMSGGACYNMHANSQYGKPTTSLNVSGERLLTGGSQLPLNTWSHLAATYDNTTQRLYVNGTLVASRAQTGPIKLSYGVLSIGGNSVWGEFFAGCLDEVRIYNKALTQAQIQADMATRM